MTDRAWDSDVLVDGYPGSLSWLLDQKRPSPAVLPSLNYASYGLASASSSTGSSNGSAALTNTGHNKPSIDFSNKSNGAIPRLSFTTTFVLATTIVAAITLGLSF